MRVCMGIVVAIILSFSSQRLVFTFDPLLLLEYYCIHPNAGQQACDKLRRPQALNEAYQFHLFGSSGA